MRGKVYVDLREWQIQSRVYSVAGGNGCMYICIICSATRGLDEISFVVIVVSSLIVNATATVVVHLVGTLSI